MKVVRYNEDSTTYLTKNRNYKVLDEDSTYFLIKDNNWNENWFLKTRFGKSNKIYELWY